MAFMPYCIYGMDAKKQPLIMAINMHKDKTLELEYKSFQNGFYFTFGAVTALFVIAAIAYVGIFVIFKFVLNEDLPDRISIPVSITNPHSQN